MWVSAVVVTLLLSSYRDFEAEGRKGNWNALGTSPASCLAGAFKPHFKPLHGDIVTYRPCFYR